MLDGAVTEYEQRGGQSDNLAIIEAPGTYELVSIANAAARSGMYGSVVCLGCVIRGETTHDEHIARAVAHGLVDISNETGIPVSYGVVTTMNIEQARSRAGGDKGNKGADAMGAALDAAAAINAINDGKSSQSPGVRFTPGLTPHDKAAIK
jgi:6,7-dimethyl-8-ribityllumazine synthase